MTQPSTPDPHTASPSAPPSAPPRPIGPKALRRSWLEPRVRICWIVAAVMLLVAVIYTVRQSISLFRDQRLISRGTAATALVESIDDSKIKGQVAAHYDHIPIAELSFDLNGRHYLVKGPLDQSRSSARIGYGLKIRVDPANPNRWTDRTEAHWARGLVIDFFLLPLIGLLILLTVLRRRSVLAIWRDQPAAEAVVVESGQSALYPASRVVGLTLTSGRDHRLITAVVPHTAGELQNGETVYLIFPPEKPGAAILASLYGP